MDSENVIVREYQKKDFNYFEYVNQEMLRFVTQNSRRILDVGCACGGFGQLLKDTRPVEVWGIELNERAAAVASQRLDHVICAGFDSSLSLPIHSFDCIIFNDVLEHLVDPFAALLYCKELLRNGGVVVASIPNVRYFHTMWDLLVHKNWQYTDSGILDRTHLRFFTQRSILSTFNTLGYCVECIEGIHPTPSRKFSFLNRLSFKQIEDMRYLQFAIVARPSNS